MKEEIKKQGYKVYEKLREIKTTRVRSYLLNSKYPQKENFERILPKFIEIERKLNLQDVDKFVQPRWVKDYKMMSNNVSDFNFSFLRNEIIRGTMFVTAEGKLMRGQLRFIKENSGSLDIKYILEEEYIGNPIISNKKYKTSHNTIHNFYHLSFYLKTTNINPFKEKNIIEWGGGYGNLARLFQKVNSNQTYTIIDLPIFSCIQWIYLSSIFGEDKVNMIESSKDKIIEGQINILPVCFIEDFDLKADLFISTWALTESSEYSQEYVFNKKMFGARDILLAFHNESSKDFNSTPIIKYINKNKLKKIPIKNQEGNSYVFK